MIIFFVNFISFKKDYISNTQDYIAALTNMMLFLTKEFENNFNAHKAMQEWNETNITKIMLVENENSQKIMDVNIQHQVYLNRMGEFLGYRPRANMGE